MLTIDPKQSTELDVFLAAQNEKSTLRFITCGSVDDGKSTLIGRLLYDSKLLLEDQITALERESSQIGRAGEELDFSLLVDGLQAEREQGITIDVAYRYFETAARKFIVADTPGHEQYTRNMATAASGAELAIILVDARKGIIVQTRRHATIAAAMGIRNVVLAINKMDLVGYDEKVFNDIKETFEREPASLEFEKVQAIPVSGLEGTNIFEPDLENTPWYDGASLMKYLESVTVETETDPAFRLPVQWVNRPNQNFRGFSGTIAGGSIDVGDTVTVLPSGMESKVKSIVTFDGELDKATAGTPVTLELQDEIDVSRGSVFVKRGEQHRNIELANLVRAQIIWMGNEPLVSGRRYIARVGTALVTATIVRLKYRINFENNENTPADRLSMNESALVDIEFDRAIPFDPYEKNRHTGAFVLIDRLSNETAGAGMIKFGLRRATNVVWHKTTIDSDKRAELKNQRGQCLWFTGLSGSGKSTIANLLDKRMYAEGFHTYILDGDNVRHGLNKDLGFTEADRVENIRRIAEVAKLMVDAGLVVIVCAISPFKRDRDMARTLFEQDSFKEIYVSAPLEICEERDPKGLYKKARAGEIPNFTGISSPYEAPEVHELTVTNIGEPTESAEKVYEHVATWMHRDKLG